MQVTLYKTPNCQACRATARMFDKKGIVYDTINLDQHPELLEQFKSIGHTQSPIVVAGNKSWSGFRMGRIEALANDIFKPQG